MPTKGIKLFEKIIVGHFDNQDQIDNEISDGQQIHPYAVHVTEVINHRISNIPSDFVGTFILEESYYTYPDGSKKIKPLFFRVTPCGEFDIHLQSVQIPDRLDDKEVVNANPDLSFDYEELEVREQFGKATYHNIGDKFVVNHLTDMGGGILFNLIETLSDGRLQVMELVKKNGHKITPYDSPIIYIRK